MAPRPFPVEAINRHPREPRDGGIANRRAGSARLPQPVQRVQSTPLPILRRNCHRKMDLPPGWRASGTGGKSGHRRIGVARSGGVQVVGIDRVSDQDSRSSRQDRTKRASRDALTDPSASFSRQSDR